MPASHLAAKGIEGTITRPTFLHQVVPFFFDTREFDRVVDIVGAARAAHRRMWTFDHRPVADALPHVDSLFFKTPPTHQSEAPTIAIWRLDQTLLNASRGWGAGVNWQLASSPDVTVRLERIELAAFTTGIGFITLEYGIPKSDRNQPVGPWLDLFRMSRYLGDKGAAMTFCRSPDSSGIVSRPGQLEGTSRCEFSATELVRSLLPSCDAIHAKIEASSARAFPFIGLLGRGVPESSQLELVMRLQRHIRSTSTYNPDPDGPLPPWFVRRDPGVWHFASMSSAGCVIFDAPPGSYFDVMLREDLPYFHHILLLLALQQRFRLIELDKETARSWKVPDVERRFVEFARLRSELVDLTSRGFVQQPSDLFWMDRYYSALRDVFQVQVLREGAESRIREIHDLALIAVNNRLREQAEATRVAESQRRIEEQERVRRADAQEEARRLAEEKRERMLVSRLSLFAALIGIPTLTLAFLGINIHGLTSGNGIDLSLAEAYALLAVVAGLLVSMAIWSVTKFFRRKEE